MKYLVAGSGGPGFASPEGAVQILGKIILPSFEALIKLETEKKILAGGLPVGDRAFVFILEASSNEEVDQLLRNIPMWGSLKWQVTPLQTFAGRASQERNAIKEIKKMDSTAKPLAPKIYYEKYPQNTLGKNKDALYAILKRRASSPFSSNRKNGGFCSRIKDGEITRDDGT